MRCFEPSITEKDVQAVSELLKSGNIGFGPNIPLFEDRFSKYSKMEYNIGMNSASSAAYCLFAYLYDKYGSCDVYTPSLGFTSVSWAAKKNGHNVHFVDVDDNLLFDFDSYKSIRKLHLERQLNVDFHKSILMPVLYGGVSDIPGFMDKIKSTGWDDIVVVDSAHCIEPTIESDYIFFSFHPVKPLTMSCGGLLSMNDKDADDYIRKYRNFGRENTGDTYDIVDNGFNFYMNNLNATLGLSQLDTCFDNIRFRKKNLEYLKNGIKSNIGYFTEHDENSSYYLGTLVLYTNGSKELRQKLRDNESNSSYHYPLLHKTKFWNKGLSLNNTERLEDRIINLPINKNLSKNDLDTIIKVINE